MLLVIALLVGVVLAFLLVWGARRQSADGARRIYAVGLLIASLVYVCFAAFGDASRRWLAFEIAGVIVYSTFAWVGVRKRSDLVLGTGWAAHALWDVLLHLHQPGAEYTPAFYLWMCVGFDLVLAGVLFRSPRRTAGTAKVQVPSVE